MAAALEGAGPADPPALEYAEDATEAAELSMAAAAAMAAAAELAANCRGTGQRGAGGHGGEDQAPTFNASPALAQVRQCPRRLASAYAAAVVRQPFKAFIVPRKDGYPRSCTEAMDAGQVEACSVSCTWDGTDARLKELRSAVMQKTCWRGFTLLRRLKDLTPKFRGSGFRVCRCIPHGNMSSFCLKTRPSPMETWILETSQRQHVSCATLKTHLFGSCSCL